MMQAIDGELSDIVVYDDDGNRCTEVAHMVCLSCGHDGGWRHFKDVEEVEAGLPCPECIENAAISTD